MPRFDEPDDTFRSRRTGAERDVVHYRVGLTTYTALVSDEAGATGYFSTLPSLGEWFGEPVAAYIVMPFRWAPADRNGDVWPDEGRWKNAVPWRKS